MGREKTFQVLVIKFLLVFLELFLVLLDEKGRVVILPVFDLIEALKDEGRIFISNTTGANKEWWNHGG